MSEYIHIVCLDAPSPPDYGGAIDMYYKIKTLHAEGMKIILHYFDYKNNRNVDGLEEYCEEINSYERSGILKSILTLQPYIVSSRTSSKLIQRLHKDNHPVLVEGIHCSGIISHMPERKFIVRVHNNEAVYYRHLYRASHGLVKKFYYLYESILLNYYQRRLPAEAAYAFISSLDKNVFKENYHQPHQVVIPSFLPWQTVSTKAGKGDYCLYHGNIAVSENFEAAAWLIKNVFSKISVPLLIAGKDAMYLRKICRGVPCVQLINNPSDFQLTELISNAQINVLPGLNTTGVKLKLLHSLFKGRFCMSNHDGIFGSGIESHVIQAEDSETWISLIKQNMQLPFSTEMIEERTKILSIYDNKANAKKLISLL